MPARSLLWVWPRGYLAGTHLIFFFGVALVGLQMAWQVSTLDIDDPENCLRRFRSNRDVGAAIFLALAHRHAAVVVGGPELTQPQKRKPTI